MPTAKYASPKQSKRARRDALQPSAIAPKGQSKPKRSRIISVLAEIPEPNLSEQIIWTRDRRVNDRDSIFTVVKVGLWEQAKQVRQGLPSSFVTQMCDALSMPRAAFLGQLQLPRSTIELRIKKNELLSPSEGDAVLRPAKALTRAQEVFEDEKAAAAWLTRSIRSLGGVTPLSLMDTDSGYELVMDTLGRIEHGVVA